MEVAEIKHCITTYFRSNNLLSQRLPQAYILYRSLQTSGKEPTLFMGYLVNHDLLLYYIHYWVELDGVVHDIIGESYNMRLTKEVDLRLNLSIHILDTYINMDSAAIEQKRSTSYHSCMRGMFFEWLSASVNPDVYEKIMAIYNKLINQ
jgi:hypothetical protein